MKSPSTRSLLFLSWYWLQFHKASLQRVFAWKTMGSLGFVGCNVWAELKSCKWMHWPIHCISSMASTNLSHHPLTTMAFWYAMAMDCRGPKSWSQASCVNIPKSLCINSYDKNHGFLRVVTSPLPNGKGITLIISHCNVVLGVSFQIMDCHPSSTFFTRSPKEWSWESCRVMSPNSHWSRVSRSSTAERCDGTTGSKPEKPTIQPLDMSNPQDWMFSFSLKALIGAKLFGLWISQLYSGIAMPNWMN